MSDSFALRRLRIRRWRPPSLEFIYHLLMSIAGLMLVASNTIHILRGKYEAWPILGLVVWSITYLIHREEARKARLGVVKPISRLQWIWLIIVFMVAIVDLIAAPFE
jgi:hypothetical protein